MAHIPDLLIMATAGAALFAVIGALFGAVAGGLARVNGHTTGGVLGHIVAEALGRSEDTNASPLVTGAIIGAVDGAFFLALVGFFGGGLASYSDPAARLEVLRGPLVAILLLAIAALLLGALASVLIWGGARAIGIGFGILAGAAIGDIVAVRCELSGGMLYGTLAGALLGIMAAVFSGPRVPPKEEAV